LRGCAHVHTPSGLAHDEQLRAGFDFSTDDVLLQIATRERLGRGLWPVGLDFVALDDGLRLLAQRLEVQPPTAPDRVGAREQEVVRQGQGGHSATAQAFVGHEVQPQAATLHWAGLRHVLLSHRDAAHRRTHVLTRQGVQQLALAIA